MDPALIGKIPCLTVPIVLHACLFFLLDPISVFARKVSDRDRGDLWTPFFGKGQAAGCRAVACWQSAALQRIARARRRIGACRPDKTNILEGPLIRRVGGQS